MSTFHYRRRLSSPELLKLVGAAAGAGAAVAAVGIYLGRIWLQRVPLKPREGQQALATGPGPDPALLPSGAASPGARPVP